MKTRNLRIKRKVVVKSRKKGKLNCKISYRRKQRKSMMRRQTRQSKYRRHNLKKKFSKKMRGGRVIEETKNFYKSFRGLGWKNASFTVNYDTSSKNMRIKWDSETHPDGLIINFNRQIIDVDGKTVNVVDDSKNSIKIVQLYSKRTANEFKAFLDSFLEENQDETTEKDDQVAHLINAIVENMPRYEDNTTFARSLDAKEDFIMIGTSLPLILELDQEQKETIKTEIFEELTKYLVNSSRFVSQKWTFWTSPESMSLPEILYYKWENDIYTRNLPRPLIL